MTDAPGARAVSAPRPRDRLLHWLGALSSGLPYLFLAYVLFMAWGDPMAWDGGRWIPFGVGLLALEFVLLHSGAFIGTAAAKKARLLDRLKLFAGLTAFYGLMAWGMAAAVGTWELLQVFGLVMAGRLVTVVTASTEGRQALINRSALGVVLYLVMAFGTIVIPVPERGIDGSVLAEVYPDRGSGLWERDPERAIAGAVFYFSAMGLAELFVFGPAGRRGGSGR